MVVAYRSLLFYFVTIVINMRHYYGGFHYAITPLATLPLFAILLIPTEEGVVGLPVVTSHALLVVVSSRTPRFHCHYVAVTCRHHVCLPCYVVCRQYAIVVCHHILPHRSLSAPAAMPYAIGYYCIGYGFHTHCSRHAGWVDEALHCCCYLPGHCYAALRLLLLVTTVSVVTTAIVTMVTILMVTAISTPPQRVHTRYYLYGYVAALVCRHHYYGLPIIVLPLAAIIVTARLLLRAMLLLPQHIAGFIIQARTFVSWRYYHMRQYRHYDNAPTLAVAHIIIPPLHVNTWRAYTNILTAFMPQH